MSSNSVSKRMKTETETNTEVELSNISDISGTSVAASIVSVHEDISNTFSSVFSEDILPEIFDNLEIVTVKDLLNFRMVNRCWRDAATSVLLKRNLCEICLDFGEKHSDEDDIDVFPVRGELVFNDNEHQCEGFPPSYNYLNSYQPKSILKELSQLISMSPKFPSTSIRFQSMCRLGFGNLSNPSSEYNNTQQHQIDLFQFFLLYGKKIKKLSLACDLSKEAVQNLLYVYMPHLLFLDLQEFHEFLFQDLDLDEEENQPQVCLPFPTTLKIREITVGYELQFLWNLQKTNFVKELIKVSPNLVAIRKVDENSLGFFLEIGTGDLIKELHFDPALCHVSTIQKFWKPPTDTILKDNLASLKLSTLVVQLNNIISFEDMDDIVVTFINLILSSSKDSLKHLELYMNSCSSIVNIYIPPLPHLKYLDLLDNNNRGTTRFHFLGDVVGRAIQTINGTLSDSTNLTNHNQGNNIVLAADYFPSLREVLLHSGEMRNDCNQIMEFLPLRPLGSDCMTTIFGGALSTVITLEVNKFQWDSENMSKIFPNVVNLYINCNNSDVLHNWVWTVFPKLEIFELSAPILDCPAHVVDSFFTGISSEKCTTIESYTPSTESDSRPAQVFERTQPYIGDCENLKEFKIIFNKKLSSKFASKVTAIYGLQEVVPRTKIIFSFQDVKLSNEEIEESRQNLNPVAAFVELKFEPSN